ncbi:hypothetical protein ACSBR2_000598 [Camellia fascicularis]
MALEWVFNLPITSKVDVYSYGIVVLMITGRSPTGVRDVVVGEEEERCERLETWIQMLDPSWERWWRYFWAMRIAMTLPSGVIHLVQFALLCP